MKRYYLEATELVLDIHLKLQFNSEVVLNIDLKQQLSSSEVVYFLVVVPYRNNFRQFCVVLTENLKEPQNLRENLIVVSHLSDLLHFPSLSRLGHVHFECHR